MAPDGGAEGGGAHASRQERQALRGLDVCVADDALQRVAGEGLEGWAGHFEGGRRLVRWGRAIRSEGDDVCGIVRASEGQGTGGAARMITIEARNWSKLMQALLSGYFELLSIAGVGRPPALPSPGLHL